MEKQARRCFGDLSPMSNERWSRRDPAEGPRAEIILTPPDRAPAPTERLAWDAVIPGLALRVRGRSRSWVVVRKHDGRMRRTTLGSAATLSPTQARALAAALTGEDVGDAVAPPSFAEFAQTFLADSAARWKPATMVSNARCVRLRLVPAFGARRIDRIEPADVRAWLDGLRVAEGTRSRALAILSGVMRHAELIGVRPAGSNPCRGLRRRRTGFKAYELRPADYAALGRALTALAEHWPMETALLRFLALTGARRGEALALEWDMIDGARVALPDSKTGPKALWLGAPARALLATLPRTTSPLVFPAPEGEDMDARLTRVWKAVRRATGLSRLRVHDLRHGFASVAAAAGEPLRTISALLGHSDMATTEGYANLARNTVAAAAKRVGAHLSAALAEKQEPTKPATRAKAPREVKTPRRAPQAKPAPRPRAPKPEAPPPDPMAAAVTAYLRSTMALPAFCRARSLDEDRLRAAVIARRKAMQEARR